MAEVAAAAASLQSLHAHGGDGLLRPPERIDFADGSADDDARASSADDDKIDAHDDGPGRPSTTVSGASSLSGAGHAASTAPVGLAPLAAKKGPQSFFSGSKIKHLKKADGIPLWRIDIQFEFLQGVFRDPERVFTNVYTGEKGCSFADIYVDAMARSSKTSKILRDKLMTERENALNMAMVCLLVNVGRMNTTLNFFPEMKAQLRTYHAIPSLQAHGDSNAYKQLQDAPRLKSILKGACEDRAEPQTLEQIMTMRGLRTNPINLVFILSTYAPKVTECHFPENMDFYDLVMRITLSSKSRARAFLWLMWFYLESDFTEQACLANPFGRGKLSRDKAKLWCVPDFEYLTEDQAAKENVDTLDEKTFGEAKREERKRIVIHHAGLLGEIQSATPNSGRGRGRKDKSFETGTSPDVHSPSGSPPPPGSGRRNYIRPNYEYDSEPPRTRSGSPESHYTPGVRTNRRILSLVKMPTENGLSPAVLETPKNRGGRPRNSAKRTVDGDVKPNQRIIITKGGRPLVTSEAAPLTNSRSLASADRSSPMVADRPVPRQRLTTHQIAVQRNRMDRVNHEIGTQLRQMDRRKQRARMKQGAIARAWSRVKDVEDPLIPSDGEGGSGGAHIELYDEEGNVVRREDDDDNGHVLKRVRLDRAPKPSNSNASRGPAGLIPRREEEMGGEDDDFGEEALSFAAAIRRARRRLQRWEEMDRRRAAAAFDGDGEHMAEQAGAENDTAMEDEPTLVETILEDAALEEAVALEEAALQAALDEEIESDDDEDV